MANSSYPPASYPESNVTMFSSNALGDPYQHGTQFFHTDFLPISPGETRDPDPTTTAHLLAIDEEKRRRNTAASARFRLKKKEREHALETTATEMSDRVRELEQKVGQLELENRWLRSLIVERRRKMSSADQDDEDGDGGHGAVRKEGGNYGGKKRGGRRRNKDIDDVKPPYEKNDGVGTM